jgi:hypothetical protein
VIPTAGLADACQPLAPQMPVSQQLPFWDVTLPHANISLMLTSSESDLVIN